MNIYAVVLDIDYEGSCFAGVFSTQGKAAAWIEEHRADEERCARYRIIEDKLDAPLRRWFEN